MSEYLAAVVSVFPSVEKTAPQRTVTIGEALAEIRDGKFRKRIGAIRELADKDARSHAKKSLPAYTFSGRFSRRAIAGLETPSGAVCLDADDLEDLDEIRARAESSPHVLACFQGPSGHQRPGLKIVGVVTPAPSTNAEHHAAYDALARELGLSDEVDAGAKDVSRLCYGSWDPDLYLNPDAVPLRVDYGPVQEGAGRGPGEEVDRLEEGRKYETLRHFGGLLRHGGASADMIRTALQALRLEHSDDPGEADPIDRLAEWLGEKDPGEYGSLSRFLRDVHTAHEPPRRTASSGVPPFVPFPVAALPPVVGAHVEEQAATLGVDPAGLALSVLPVLHGAVGNSRAVSPKPGWIERPSMWGAVILPSGAMKSQMVRVAVEPVLKLESEAAAEYAVKRDLYEEEMEAYNGLSKTAKAQAERPAKPDRQRYRTGDPTAESLVSVLAEIARALLLYRDELSGWLSGMNQYKGGRGSDLANWIEMHAGQSIVIDRKSDERGVLHVEYPNVSVVGTIQGPSSSRRSRRRTSTRASSPASSSPSRPASPAAGPTPPPRPAPSAPITPSSAGSTLSSPQGPPQATHRRRRSWG